MKTTLLFLFSGWFLFHLSAQSVTHEWSIHWGGLDADPGPVLVTDSAGNVYTSGTFIGSVDFNPGPGEAIVQPTPFTREGYISMFDAEGQFQWVAILRTTSAITIRDMITDGVAYLILTGDYVGTVDFDPGPGVFNLTSTGFATETFVLKLTLDGDFVWANTTSGTGQKYGSVITMDAAGNIYGAGIFTGTGDFNTGPGVEEFSAQSFVDGFISKFDADGQFIWSLHHTGSFQIGIYAIAADSEGNFYIGGAFDDIRDFDPGPDSLILTASGAWDGFIQKFDTDGHFLWVNTMANAEDNWVFDLVIDTTDNIIATGYYSGTLDFDPGPEEDIHTAILNDIYVSKHNPAGGLLWVAVFTGTSFDRGNAVALDKNGYIYTTGFFGEEVDFDPGPGNHTLTSTGNLDTDDGFLSILNPDGQFVFGANFGGKENDLGSDLAVDQEGNMVICGAFAGKAAFYPDAGAPDSLLSNGETDVFLLKWNQCLVSQGEISITECDETYTSPSGQFTWVENGTYVDVLINEAGCDSLLTIHLMFADIDSSVVIIPELNLLMAAEPDAMYQWVDCFNNYAFIDGATAQEFTAEASGQYAVILTKDGCVDTSSCVELITDVSLPDPPAGFHVFPNPFQQDLNILFDMIPSGTIMQMRNTSGQMVWKARTSGSTQESFHLDLPRGVYFLETNTSSGSTIVPLVRL